MRLLQLLLLLLLFCNIVYDFFSLLYNRSENYNWINYKCRFILNTCEDHAIPKLWKRDFSRSPLFVFQRIKRLSISNPWICSSLIFPPISTMISATSLGPIYTVRLWRMRQAYDRPTTWFRTIYTRTTFSLTNFNVQKFAPGFTERKF